MVYRSQKLADYVSKEGGRGKWADSDMITRGRGV